MTASMLAWKQPFIQRVRNSSLVEELGMDNNRVLNLLPKPWDQFMIGRGAFQSASKRKARAAVERLEKQM